MDRTKEYAWILGILRRLRNSLAKLITTFNAFETNHSVYFDLDADGALQDYFREHFNGIRKNAAELGALHMILEQRIETLEKMASLVCIDHSIFIMAGLVLTTEAGERFRSRREHDGHPAGRSYQASHLHNHCK